MRARGCTLRLKRSGDHRLAAIALGLVDVRRRDRHIQPFQLVDPRVGDALPQSRRFRRLRATSFRETAEDLAYVGTWTKKIDRSLFGVASQPNTKLKLTPSNRRPCNVSYFVPRCLSAKSDDSDARRVWRAQSMTLAGSEWEHRCSRPGR